MFQVSFHISPKTKISQSFWKWLLSYLVFEWKGWKLERERKEMYRTQDVSSQNRLGIKTKVIRKSYAWFIRLTSDPPSLWSPVPFYTEALLPCTSLVCHKERPGCSMWQPPAYTGKHEYIFIYRDISVIQLKKKSNLNKSIKRTTNQQFWIGAIIYIQSVISSHGKWLLDGNLIKVKFSQCGLSNTHTHTNTLCCATDVFWSTFDWDTSVHVRHICAWQTARVRKKKRETAGLSDIAKTYIYIYICICICICIYIYFGFVFFGLLMILHIYIIFIILYLCIYSEMMLKRWFLQSAEP